MKHFHQGQSRSIIITVSTIDLSVFAISVIYIANSVISTMSQDSSNSNSSSDYASFVGNTRLRELGCYINLFWGRYEVPRMEVEQKLVLKPLPSSMVMKPCHEAQYQSPGTQSLSPSLLTQPYLLANLS